MRLITALGTGVLVGTSLIVIIPEGVETLYSASGSSHSHAERSLGNLGRRGIAHEIFPGGLKHDTWRRGALPNANYLDGAAISDLGGDTAGQDQYTGGDDIPPPRQHDENAPLGDQNDAPSSEPGHEREPHAYVGISLILGFILMYLIDTIPQTASSATPPQSFQISLNQFSLTRTPSIPNNANSADTTVPTSGTSRPSSTTVGLVIHAAADGIALGVSSTTTGRLTFIIFLALMIHKAPAAFGLTSVLLKQGLSKRMARAHLIVFSLAAPIGALLTWGGAHLLGYSSSTLGRSVSTEFATGMLLLFSAGTFLYVAMHTMQEATSGRHGHDEADSSMNGYAGVSSLDYYEQQGPPPGKKDGPTLLDTLVTVAGMLLPLLTQWGHAH